MPAGLDGNPDPVTTPDRDAVLGRVAAAVVELGPRRRVIGIDGRSGSGKSTFADELGRRLEAAGQIVVRSTIDSFHRPRNERMVAGSASAEGYYKDSHQIEVVVEDLLEPFAAGAPQVRTAAFDEPTDSPLDEWCAVPDAAVLLFDGLFLHRPELVEHWHASVYLEADRRRDRQWLDFLLADLSADPVAAASAIDERLSRARWPRYREGWELYLREADPRGRASFVVDNEDLEHPRVVEHRPGLPTRIVDDPDRPGA